MLVVTELIAFITAALIAAHTVLTYINTATIVRVTLIYVCNNDAQLPQCYSNTTVFHEYNNVANTFPTQTQNTTTAHWYCSFLNVFAMVFGQ